METMINEVMKDALLASENMQAFTGNDVKEFLSELCLDSLRMKSSITRRYAFLEATAHYTEEDKLYGITLNYNVSCRTIV